MEYSKDNVSMIKKGASILTKGGTLSSEPCPKCSGVQVRLGDKTTCINCGKQETVASVQSGAESDKVSSSSSSSARRSAILTSLASIIEEKIAMMASELRAEDDISQQMQRVELLERYLVILEKTKALTAQ
ncbi:MAG TPA: Sjogren's syndrome/scleroderma autoantigen 1 family protein [Nitrososphaera sp.]|nr:Sjogren's syndrome/scleroderma autoantigen 1 family protein [Nitrososphaera sp.]